MVPAVHPSIHVDRIDTALPQGIGGVLAAGSTAAHHEVGSVLLELADPLLDVSDWNMFSVGDVGDASLESGSHIDNLKVWVVLVVFDHFVGLLSGDVGRHIRSEKSQIKTGYNPTTTPFHGSGSDDGGGWVEGVLICVFSPVFSKNVLIILLSTIFCCKCKPGSDHLLWTMLS